MSLSKQELQDFYDSVTESSYYRPYVVLTKKINEVCDSFENAFIDITGEDATFKNFTEFGKVLTKWLEEAEKMRAKLNPQEAAKAKAEEKATRVNPLSLERFVKGE